MIARLTGTLESIEGVLAVVSLDGGALAHEVLVPAYFAEKLAGKVGARVTFVTFQYLESQGQGASFIPRLIGFAQVADRRFFELFTTVKGIGYRKALRAMAAEPGVIAGAIASRDAKSLTKLPEIGKRMAETIIAELSGKVEAFLAPGEMASMDAHSSNRNGISGGVTEDTVMALMSLGEPRIEAESLVSRALERAKREQRAAESVEDLLGVIFAMRGR